MGTEQELVERELLEQVRAVLGGVETEEVRMFGGTGFMLNGNLLAAASKRGLLLRVGPAQLDKVLARQGARPLLMRGRVMKDYAYIDPPGLNKAAVGVCIRMALKFVKTLPANAARAKARTKAKAGTRRA